MDIDEPLSLAEWVVLAVVDEEPTHGFAVSSLTATGGSIGRVWQVPRPVVYRALNRLTDLGLVEPQAVEAGRGPQRVVHASTAAGRTLVRTWLQTPVDHVREVRSFLLLKLALLDRRGADPSRLLARQRAVLDPIVRAMTAERDAEGFEATLLAWRRATATAAATFLEEVSAAASAASPASPRAEAAPRRTSRSAARPAGGRKPSRRA